MPPLSEQELAELISGLQTQPLKRPPAEPLLCIICGEPLNACHADLMTHPNCDPEPKLPELPPPTVPLLGEALARFDANSPRSQQVAIGPSQIAVPCDRRLAYSLRGQPVANKGPVPWAPLVGTAVHALIADALRADNALMGRERWLIEHRVWPDPAISGSCDCYDTDTDTVIDWKIVGQTALEEYAKQGPGQQYAGQAHLYGRGWQRAGYRPQWVRIVFLPRASSQIKAAHEWTAPYSRLVADTALDRMYSLIDVTRLLEVDDHPDMWEAVPALPSRLCNYCPYLRRGAPADDTGCPGDTEADATAIAKFADGIIVRSGAS